MHRPTVPELIRQYQQSAPVDVVALAERLGVPVELRELDPEISGELERRPDGGYRINVNRRHAATRQRFTVAHELGHYLFHRDLIGSGIDDDRAYRSTNVGRYYNTRIGPREETEANRFAASLLMPEALVRKLKTAQLTAPQMAQLLGVSVQAMEIRLEASP